MNDIWITPLQPKSIEKAIEHFDTFGKENFDYRGNYNIGDIIYIYECSPIKEIYYKCIVADLNYFLKENDEITKSKIKNETYSRGPKVELKPVFKFELDGQLSLDKLYEHGLKTIRTSHQVNDDLLDYIKTVEANQSDPEKYERYLRRQPIEELKQLAKKYESKKSAPKVVTTNIKSYDRNKFISSYAKQKAKGVCQLCGNNAPFLDKHGYPYLESHHIIWLSQGGFDTIENTVALCPNCHKKMHIIADENDVCLLMEKAKEN